MSNKKKIVYVEANEDGTIGGSYYSLLDFLKRLDREIYEPIVCFYQENDLVKEYKKHVKVVILRNPKGVSFRSILPSAYKLFSFTKPTKVLFLLAQKIFNLFRFEALFYIEIILFVIRNKIDIIHINNAPILSQWLLASKVTRTPVVSHVRGNMDLPAFQKKLVPYYDKVISISKSVTNYAKEQGIDTSNFIQIYNGIDVDELRSKRTKSVDETIKSMSIKKGKILIGVVGNLKRWKGQNVLLEAIDILQDKYPEILCLIIGDVSNLQEDKQYFHEIEELIDKRDLKEYVVFTGYRQDIPDIISALDILVLTSVEPEPLGRVVLEGMAFSKPVIATAHGGPLEIIEDNVSGILVKPSDGKELAKKISSVLSDHEFRESVCKSAVNRVESKFSIDSNARQVSALYESL